MPQRSCAAGVSGQPSTATAAVDGGWQAPHIQPTPRGQQRRSWGGYSSQVHVQSATAAGESRRVAAPHGGGREATVAAAAAIAAGAAAAAADAGGAAAGVDAGTTAGSAGVDTANEAADAMLGAALDAALDAVMQRQGVGEKVPCSARHSATSNYYYYLLSNLHRIVWLLSD